MKASTAEAYCEGDHRPTQGRPPTIRRCSCSTRPSPPSTAKRRRAWWPRSSGPGLARPTRP